MLAIVLRNSSRGKALYALAEAEYDAVIVGSGAGGGIAALVLCEAGLNVLLLERGRRYDFRTDYPMSHADWERRGDPFVEASHETVMGRCPTRFAVTASGWRTSAPCASASDGS